MNTVWIIDDDRSIRWVLEKALGREGIDHASFSSAGDALAEVRARRSRRPRCYPHPHARRVPGWTCCRR